MFNNLIKKYFCYADIVKSNKKNFPQNKTKKNFKVLVEFNGFHNTHIALSYLANILAKKKKSDINAFYNYSLISSPIKNNIVNQLRWKIGDIFSLRNFGIYRSFGVKIFFRPYVSIENKIKSEKYLKKIFSKIKKKEDVLKIKFDDVLVGDLIYDTYLKHYIEPTLDIKNIKFYNLLKNFLFLYFFWKNYFKKNKISSVVGVHTPYSYGLVLRIAIKKNIPAYAASSRFIYSLDKKMPYMHGHFKTFSKVFKKFDNKIKIKALNLAKKRLDLRFKGVGGSKVDLISSEKSSFGSKKFQSLILPSRKIKILITPHDFFDAAHIYGNTLFPDFFEWLNYLGKLSENTNYDWYLKNRPNFEGKFKIYQPHTNQIINVIVKKFPKLKLLPNDYSHHQIIKEKIDFVLTCYGSVGVEYPYFNIPVINASVNNPHINYNFNLHPKSKSEYKKIIENLNKIKKKKLRFSKKDIYEYYFMRNIYTDKNWLVEDLPKMIKYVGGFDGQFTTKFYKYWLENFSEEKHNKTIKSIDSFIDSGQNFISIRHTGKLVNYKY